MAKIQRRRRRRRSTPMPPAARLRRILTNPPPVDVERPPWSVGAAACHRPRCGQISRPLSPHLQAKRRHRGGWMRPSVKPQLPARSREGTASTTTLPQDPPCPNHKAAPSDL